MSVSGCRCTCKACTEVKMFPQGKREGHCGNGSNGCYRRKGARQ